MKGRRKFKKKIKNQSVGFTESSPCSVWDGEIWKFFLKVEFFIIHLPFLTRSSKGAEFLIYWGFGGIFPELGTAGSGSLCASKGGDEKFMRSPFIKTAEPRKMGIFGKKGEKSLREQKLLPKLCPQGAGEHPWVPFQQGGSLNPGIMTARGMLEIK